MKNEEIQPKAILVDLLPPRFRTDEAVVRMKELESLVNTHGGFEIVKKIQTHNKTQFRTFIGSGKVEEIKEEFKNLGASYLILNNILKPQQIFNLSEDLRDQKVEVWDRVDLILQIFSLHAKSQEAQLQIELARIRHLGPRIFGMGAELVKQTGGIGNRGIGESNTEIMKRHMREHEGRIRKKIEKIEAMHSQQRKARQRKNLKTISIVGYTNAGKTTLMNALTGRKEYVANELFATLDTRVGQLYLPGLQKMALLSDTIGFIRDLPPELISAFHSTLSETVHANLLLHVVDAGDPDLEEKIEVVDEILTNLEVQDKLQILVFNKADLIKPAKLKKLKEAYAKRHFVFVSAEEKTGFEDLLNQIEKML